MKKRLLTTWKLGVAAVAMLVGLGTNSFTSKAAFEAQHYDIRVHGGTFDGNQYKLEDGTVITDSFFCDGTYTYFLQADGTPMKDRLTYHPDGEQVIYFDANGHECFNTFANVKMSISGQPVDDLCYFSGTGNMYVNVITYDVTGTYIYYANPYGVMERNGVFQLDTNATNYEALANGCLYGYANADGTVAGFYKTAEEAAQQNENTKKVRGWWKSFGYLEYDGEGNQIGRLNQDGDTTYIYRTENGKEYLSDEYTYYYDENGNCCGYEDKWYVLKSDGSGETYVANYKFEEYDGNKLKKSTFVYSEMDGDLEEKSITTYKYKDGKLSSATTQYNVLRSGEVVYVCNPRKKFEYDENELITKITYYEEDGVDSYDEYLYTKVNGKKVLAKINRYDVNNEGKEKLISFEEYSYDEQGQQIEEVRYNVDAQGNAKGYHRTENVYDENGNQIKTVNYSIDNAGKEQIAGEGETIYVKNGDKWDIAKSMGYQYRNGEKSPTIGYEYQYDEKGNVTKYTKYGTDGKNFKVNYFTVYNNFGLNDDICEEGSTELVQTQMSFDGNGECTGYRMESFVFVPYN